MYYFPDSKIRPHRSLISFQDVEKTVDYSDLQGGMHGHAAIGTEIHLLILVTDCLVEEVCPCPYP